MTDPVLVTRHDSVTVITLNRPDRLNAFNGAVLEGLMQAFLACRDDDACRAVIVTGAGRGFCAGQDLTAREIAVTGDRPDLGAGLESAYNPLILLMRDMDKPIISAVNGIAAGAGANFALAADFVVAARSATFLQAFARIGLIPDAGGTWWLTHHLGEPRAKALALLAEPLPAEQAAEWGLIHKAVDDDKLMEEAQGLARRLAAGPTRAYALTKRAIHAASRNALETQLTLERELQREAGYSDDFIEGVSAFLEKRPAKFTGR